MIDINWTLLGLAVLLFEAATGGLLTANVVGAGHAAGKAGGSAIASSAKSAYATRAATLEQSAIGRWRLKAEAKAGRLGKAVGLAAWRFGLSGVAVIAEGARAATEAVPEGAAKGRAVRQEKLAKAKRDAVQFVNDWRVGRAMKHDRCHWSTATATGIQALCGAENADGKFLCPEHDAQFNAEGQPLMTTEFADDGDPGHPKRQPAGSAGETEPTGDPDWSQDPWIEGPPAPICGACKKPVKDGLCACGMFARWPNDDTTSASESPERGTEEPVSSSTNLDSAGEKVGVVKYLAAWDGEVGGLELVASTLDALKDRVTTSGEVNKVHDPDGVTDIAGKVDAAIQAVLAAGEAIDGHAAALHQKWDSTVEHAKSTGAESADELLGAH